MTFVMRHESSSEGDLLQLRDGGKADTITFRTMRIDRRALLPLTAATLRNVSSSARR
jgi:hypothetical protein